jgi:hypothetical protein
MYQPVSYRLAGRGGSRAELRDMIAICRAAGVRVYGDAVINHMTGSGVRLCCDELCCAVMCFAALCCAVLCWSDVLCAERRVPVPPQQRRRVVRDVGCQELVGHGRRGSFLHTGLPVPAQRVHRRVLQALFRPPVLPAQASPRRRSSRPSRTARSTSTARERSTRGPILWTSTPGGLSGSQVGGRRRWAPSGLPSLCPADRRPQTSTRRCRSFSAALQRASALVHVVLVALLTPGQIHD